MYMGIKSQMALQRAREEMRICPRCGETLLDTEKRDVRRCPKCRESHNLIEWICIKNQDLFT